MFEAQCKAKLGLARRMRHEAAWQGSVHAGDHSIKRVPSNIPRGLVTLVMFVDHSILHSLMSMSECQNTWGASGMLLQNYCHVRPHSMNTTISLISRPAHVLLGILEAFVTAWLFLGRLAKASLGSRLNTVFQLPV